MKKFMICALGALAAVSLAACSPTKVESTTEASAERPEMVMQETGGASDKVPDPNAPELDLVFVYSGNEDATGLVQDLEGVENMDAQTLVGLLIEKGILEEGTEAISFDMEGGEKAGPGVEAAETAEGERTGILNLSKIPSSGTSGEMVILSALGNTFIENFELDRLKLLINGENYSSGHISHEDDDYLTYLEDYGKFQ